MKRDIMVVLFLKVLVVIGTIGVIVPFIYHVIFKKWHISEFSFSTSLTIGIICMLLLIVVFSIIFALSFFHSRCKICGKSWCVVQNGTVILNQYQYKDGNMLVNVVESLEERVCNNCQYVYRSKIHSVKKRVIPHKKQNPDKAITTKE